MEALSVKITTRDQKCQMSLFNFHSSVAVVVVVVYMAVSTTSSSPMMDPDLVFKSSHIKPFLACLYPLLGTFTKLQKATISFVMSARLSVHVQ
jgi:ABC-type uncharacterized transport system permease subunit